MKICPVCGLELVGVLRDSWECPKLIKNVIGDLDTDVRPHYLENGDGDIFIYIDNYCLERLYGRDYYIIHKMYVYNPRYYTNYEYEYKIFEPIIELPCNSLDVKSEDKLLNKLKIITVFL